MGEAWLGGCLLLGRGVPAPGGMPGPRGGGSGPGGCLLPGGGIPACTVADLPCGQFLTPASENVTLPQTLFAGGN